MKNKLVDLNNHLFAELERLSEEDLKGEKLTEEINRSKAVADIASKIIANGALALKSKLATEKSNDADLRLPTMLEE
ncbi:hypothetical protein [Ethanoligenens harbinense]|uniref:Phage protein n=1 Tax=Ethanoligenens harbinense (strain DSM 18485 / JCM 12961 / CGMCC 1.5033 / YUAN-3) TaxID=663278 RepID=E6U5C4_ETHHY|nr:hypothetical protein [Ethanoligenens harbinense]ADU27937.1 phage protein [Ethanoligenens harbinense YUAN-3]AVQ96966.1 hypothetical protein CXQ68_12550 [Ethanoligenens harbinense YUAN-3]AYF39626.1 hypothetical protein CXP51_12445 [Ethanoligenens harbinense]AYF42454.1 hypothetical protein CN246_13000 [Ethanoligenens harbinense]QCN93207.1 hypothetical protein DRA42_12595 [Ethanoligenens harbinense]